MGRRQQDRERAAFAPPEDVHSLEAGGVQHSMGILHPLLQRLDAGRPVREACTGGPSEVSRLFGMVGIG